MTGADIRLSAAAPDASAFKALRDDCGWGVISLREAQAALLGSHYTIAAYDGETLIGFGRIIGDGVLNFYIQDVIVSPLYRGLGLGGRMVDALITRSGKSVTDTATLGLMCARDKQGLYSKRGFRLRPNNGQGPGMSATYAQLRNSQTA